MKDKKRLIKTLSCALTLAVACSCGADVEKQTEAPTLPKTEAPPPFSENVETTASAAEEDPEVLIGADGNPVPTEKGRKAEGGDQWHFDDFTFYREATGLTFSDDSYLEKEDLWKVLRVGEVFGALTVAQAYCEYQELALQYETAAIYRLPDHDAIWYSRSVTFDGTVTLYGRLFADMREGAFGGGVLLFQPNAASLKEAGFPMLKSVHFSWAKDPVYARDVYPVEDSDIFILGDAVEYADIFDYAGYINEDESISVYAEVQLTDIKVNYGTPTGSYPCGDSRAKLLTVQMIDSPVSANSEGPEPTEPQEDFSDDLALSPAAAEGSVFSAARKIIEDHFLGVWENESNEKFRIGIAEESDCGDFFDGHGLLWDAALTDTSAVIECQNFISERFRIVIDFCDPDVLLLYDSEAAEPDDCTKKYTRVGRASMYPDTGVMNGYLESMLYLNYGYFEFSTEIGLLSTDPIYFQGENAKKALTILISHDDQKIVFASSFVSLVNQGEEEKITYLRYAKIKNEGAWVLGELSYLNDEAIETMIQGIELKPTEPDPNIRYRPNDLELDYATARYTTGLLFETNQFDDYVEAWDEKKRDNQEESPVTQTIRTGDALDEKTVVTYAGTIDINRGNCSLYLAGEFRLSGILRHRKETAMLSEAGLKGDLFFYPFPESISDDPFILRDGRWFDPQHIVDRTNNYYFFADTIELLLGNTETDRINTRLDFLFDDARCPEIEYCGEIEEYLNENEYYYAEFVFSNLYLHDYRDRMTGYVFSGGDIREIVSIEPFQP